VEEEALAYVGNIQVCRPAHSVMNMQTEETEWSWWVKCYEGTNCLQTKLVYVIHHNLGNMFLHNMVIFRAIM